MDVENQNFISCKKFLTGTSLESRTSFDIYQPLSMVSEASIQGLSGNVMDASGNETLSKIALTLYVPQIWCFALHLVKEPYRTLLMVKGTVIKSKGSEIDTARQFPYNDSVVDHDEGQCGREGTSAPQHEL
jgi:hypothetical protein